MLPLLSNPVTKLETCTPPQLTPSSVGYPGGNGNGAARAARLIKANTAAASVFTSISFGLLTLRSTPRRPDAGTKSRTAVHGILHLPAGVVVPSMLMNRL